VKNVIKAVSILSGAILIMAGIAAAVFSGLGLSDEGANAGFILGLVGGVAAVVIGYMLIRRVSESLWDALTWLFALVF